MGVPVGKLCNVVCCRNKGGKPGHDTGMVYPHTPAALEAMGPDWLTAALRHTGVLGARTRVASFSIHALGGPVPLAGLELGPQTGSARRASLLAPNSERGLLGLTRVIHVEYAADSGDSGTKRYGVAAGPPAPRTLAASPPAASPAAAPEPALPPPTRMLAKFAPSDLKTRITTDLFELAKAELMFYRRMQPQLSPATLLAPRCYFADMNLSTMNYVLLLEFLGDADFPDQLSSDLPLSDALLHVSNLARLHARWWGAKCAPDARRADPALSWLNDPSNPVYKLFPSEARRSWSLVRDRKLAGPAAAWTYSVPADFAENVESILGNLLDFMVWASRDLTMLSVTHGDPRLDNVYFVGSAGPSRRAGLLDWQTAIVAPGPSDVAWFMLGQAPEWQAQHEAAVLDGYAAALRDAGVTVGREDVDEAYALSHVTNVCKALLAAGGIDVASAHAASLADRELTGAFALWSRRDCAAAWRRWLAAHGG